MSTTGPMDPLNSYRASMGYLQRSELDDQGLVIPSGEISTALRTALAPNTRLPVWLAEVRGISRFWSTDVSSEASCGYLTRDILAGLHGQHIPVYYLIRGEPKRIRLYIGTMVDNKESGATVRAAFSSYYPGVKLWPEKDLADVEDRGERKEIAEQWGKLDEELQQGIRPFINSCQYLGVVTGVPTPGVGEKSDASMQVDRLIRGLYGARWAFLVMAEPVEDVILVEMQLAILREQIRVEQEEGFREWRESLGRSVAIYYDQLLQMRRQFLEDCLYEGGWWAQSYICSPDLATYQRAKGLVKSIFSGDLSRVDRIRVLDCFGAAPKAASFSPIVVERPQAPSAGLGGTGKSFKYHTLVSSGQLSALIHLPRIEMPGYYIQESATFDVSSHVPAGEKSIGIGEILDRGRPTGNLYRVPIKELTKHCLLVGITGSGKTNTSKYLFQQLQQLDIPVLVIEPAKREYRRLARLLPPGKELCVFTVGEEGQNAAPFRLNPFEVRPGTSVQTHIDLLKSVFNASFGMWTPLPQVLERAIHEVYRDKGWDPVQSVNERALAGEAGKATAWHFFAQPTLTDLYHKVGELVPRLGYDAEVERNVKTALETRINSLRIGAKGLMLDTRSSIPIECLLAQPTVLELEGVGDDDEKAFIMGLILVALYEYYRGSRLSADWMHITVIEEAHRLLTNVPASTDPEAANLKGKAVETFVNMLSEVRAYGEGFIIAEQIPTKLAPDVIKNTALKIMHRTVSIDDRQSMGGAMNLSEQQLRQVVSLGTGEAVVHGGGKFGDDNAILIRMPEVKERDRQDLAAEDIRKAWERFGKGYGLAVKFLAYPTCELSCRPQNEKCADARTVAEDPRVEEAFATFVVSLVPGSLSCDESGLSSLPTQLYPVVRDVIRARITGKSQDFDQTRCVLTHALYRYMQVRGAQYGWQYAHVAQMTGRFLPALLAAAGGKAMDSAALDGLRAFCQEYSNKCRLEYAPFFGCERVCGGSKPFCLYRYNVEPLLNDDVLDSSFSDVEPNDDEALARVCESAAERVLVLPDEASRTQIDRACFQSAALCFLIQKTYARPANWPVKNRQKAIDQLLAYYGR